MTTSNLINALAKTDYNKEDKATILDMMKKHPDVVKTLTKAKDNNAEPLFTPEDINDILLNCPHTIKNHPEKITNCLTDPKQIEILSTQQNKAYTLYEWVGEPLSTENDTPIKEVKDKSYKQLSNTVINEQLKYILDNFGK